MGHLLNVKGRVGKSAPGRTGLSGGGLSRVFSRICNEKRSRTPGFHRALRTFARLCLSGKLSNRRRNNRFSQQDPAFGPNLRGQRLRKPFKEAVQGSHANDAADSPSLARLRNRRSSHDGPVARRLPVRHGGGARRPACPPRRRCRLRPVPRARASSRAGLAHRRAGAAPGIPGRGTPPADTRRLCRGACARRRLLRCAGASYGP